MSAAPESRKPRVALPAILIGIGAFLVALALMMAFVVVPSQKVMPLDADSISLTEEAPANLFIAADFAQDKPTPSNADRPECRPQEEPAEEEPAEGEEAEGEPAPEDGEVVPAHDEKAEDLLPMSCFMERGVPVIAQRQVYSVEPGDKDTVTLQAAQAILRTDRLDSGDGTDALVNATLDRITGDRKTGEPVDGNNGSVQMVSSRVTEDAPTEFHRQGLQYKFPFDAKQQDYDYFDLSTMTVNPIHFVEESEVNGVKVNVYRQELGPIDMFESLSKHFQETEKGFSETVNTILTSYNLKSPAVRWGIEDGDPMREVSMHRFYTNTRTLKVAQSTGQIMFGQEEQFQFFAQNQQEAEAFWNDKAAVQQERENPTRTAISYTGTWDQATIDRATASTKETEGRMNTMGTMLPIGLGIIGLLFVLGGVLTMRRKG